MNTQIPAAPETPAAPAPRVVPGVEDAAAVHFVTERARAGRSVLLWVIAGLALLAIWQLGITLFAPKYIATPIGTLLAAPAVLSDPVFWSDAISSLVAVIEGLAIAVVLGTVLGLAMGRLPDLNRVLGLYVNAFYAIPLIAITPLLTVWFGYSPAARLALIVIEAVLPIIYNVAEGARLVAANYLDVTRIHRAPWWRVWGGVVLPNAVPYVLAGLDLAIGRALIGAVVAEFLTAVDGLGTFINYDVHSFLENNAMVALVAIVLFALVVRALVNLAVRRGLPWYRPANQEA